MWTNLVIALCLTAVTIFTLGLYENDTEKVNYPIRHKVENEEILKRWETASKSFDQIAWSQKQFFQDAISQIISDSSYNVTSACKNSLGLLSTGLTERKLWATKFIDATGKGKSGLAYGYVSDIGHMDECLSIDTKVEGSQMAGQYCMVNLNFPLFNKSLVRQDYKHRLIFNVDNSQLQDTVHEVYAKHMEMMMFSPTTFRFGLCFPSSCDKSEIEQYLVKNLNGTEIQPSISPFCETKDRPMESHHKLAIIISAAYIGFVCLANLITNYFEHESSFLDYFNVTKNTEKLYAESSDPLSKRLSFFHGTRFYYQLVAISAHMIDIQPMFSTIYPIFYNHEHYWFLKQLYRSTGFFVQIPFAISGCLTACMLYPHFMKKKGNVNYLDLAFKRWFRSTPTLLGVLLLGYAVAGLGSGPVFREGQQLTIERCNKHWILSVLYINNWFHHDYHCLFHTWANSADMQCYLISFIVLTVMAKYSAKLGVYTAIGISLFCMSLSSFAVWWKDLPPYPNFDASDTREYEISPWIYFHTYHHVPAYMIGFLVGYCIMEDKQIPEKYAKYSWYVLYTLVMPLIVIPHYWYTSVAEPTRWHEVLFAGVHRPIFASMFIWVGYLSAFDMGGIFQWLFTIRLWIPFGRMSLSVFLAHFTFVWFDMPNSQDYVHTRVWNLVTRFTYTLVLSWIYSYFVYLLFEAPSMSWARQHMKKEMAAQASAEQLIYADKVGANKLSGGKKENLKHLKLKGS